jgi:hypothetical protein
MPAVSAFKKDFQLGKRFLGKFAPVETVEILHVMIEEFRKYEFPIHVVFKRELTDDEKGRLQIHFSNEKTILSQYGNPYWCSIRDIKILDKEITATGVGIRIFT